MRRSSSPASIEVRPMNRICPSDISVSRRNVSRHSAGSRNGSTPSMMSISANAVSRMFPIDHSRQTGIRAGSAPFVPSPPGRGARGKGQTLLGRLAGRLEILEELGIRLENQDVVPVPEALLVRFEAAIEGIELGIGLVGAGVD